MDDSGWDCHVTILDSATVVRVPRRPEVQRVLSVEARLLGEMAAQLPVAVPVPQRVCPVHGSMLYDYVPGDPLDAAVLSTAGPERLVDQLARALRAWWCFPPQRAHDLGVTDHDFASALDDFAARVLPLVGDDRAARLLEIADAELREPRQQRLIHADLGPAHLRCDATGLVGVIDWSDVSLGDPAVDLSWVLNGLDRRLRDPLIATLGADQATVDRADLVYRLGPWSEVVHGLNEARPDFVDSGLAGVRDRLLTMFQ